MAFANSPTYSITYTDYTGVNFANSPTYSFTYTNDAPDQPENSADSAPYAITYTGDYEPISSVGTDSIGQHCAVMKALGNGAGGNMHFAVRTTGPYTQGDGDIVRSGEGAVFTASAANLSRQSVLVVDLEPATNHYWAVAFDTGAETATGQFTTKPSPADEAGLKYEGVQP